MKCDICKKEFEKKDLIMGACKKCAGDIMEGIEKRIKTKGVKYQEF